MRSELQKSGWPVDESRYWKLILSCFDFLKMKSNMRIGVEFSLHGMWEDCISKFEIASGRNLPGPICNSLQGRVLPNIYFVNVFAPSPKTPFSGVDASTLKLVKAAGPYPRQLLLDCSLLLRCSAALLSVPNLTWGASRSSRIAAKACRAAAIKCWTACLLESEMLHHCLKEWLGLLFCLISRFLWMTS